MIPQIDVFLDDGYTKEEWKMVAETKKILDPKIKVTATCVRVPVFVGHSEAINIEFEEFLDWRGGAATSCARRRACMRDRQARARRLHHARSNASARTRPMSAASAQDPTVENGLALWCVSRQPAQGRGAERRADRRAAGQPAS